jgi:hypothetical protein
MIRWILAGAFYRWGLFGLLCALLLLAAAAWWFLATFWWLITGAVYVFGVIAGLVYFSLLVALIARLRARRRDTHLMRLGRRREWFS